MKDARELHKDAERMHKDMQKESTVDAQRGQGLHGNCMKDARGVQEGCAR